MKYSASAVDRNGTDKPRLDFIPVMFSFFTWPSLGGRIKCCNPSVRPSVPCLRFTRNRKAVETSLFGGDVSLDRSNLGRKFEVERLKIKVTGNEKWDRFTSKQDQHDHRPILHNRQIHFTGGNDSFFDVFLSVCLPFTPLSFKLEHHKKFVHILWVSYYLH